jgi:hypothetical protein
MMQKTDQGGFGDGHLERLQLSHSGPLYLGWGFAVVRSWQKIQDPNKATQYIEEKYRV